MSNKNDSENDVMLKLQHIRNYEEFSLIDNNIQSCNEDEVIEEAIVELSGAKEQKTSEIQESEECEHVTDQDTSK
jgi:hypothetical protein